MSARGGRSRGQSRTEGGRETTGERRGGVREGRRYTRGRRGSRARGVAGRRRVRASGGAGPGTKTSSRTRAGRGESEGGARARRTRHGSASRRAGDAPTAQELGPARVDGGAVSPRASPRASILHPREPTSLSTTDSSAPVHRRAKTSRVVGPLARALARRPSSSPSRGHVRAERRTPRVRPAEFVRRVRAESEVGRR